MALAAIRTGVKFVQTAQRISKKYQYINPTDKFIRKFVPPNYRSKATRFARYAEAGSFGGIAYEIAQDLLSDGTSNPNAIPKRFPSRNANPQRKTYNRFKRSSNRRSYKHKCPKRCRKF